MVYGPPSVRPFKAGRGRDFEEVPAHLAFTLRMPRRVALLTILCLVVFAGRAAGAEPRGRAPGGKELKRAGAVLSKLRRLEEAASSGDAARSAKAARKLFPALYAGASGLREGSLKTDLSTAIALYESALRAGTEGGAAPDCSRELRKAYARLCGEGGGRAGLLRAKARLHARWAEAELLYVRGDRAAATREAVSAVRAERATDAALAEEALHLLEELLGGAGREAPSGENVTRRLEQVERILASLPRDRARQLLRDARDSFRDALYWQLKAGPARALVVNASAFAVPGELPRLGLGADAADRAALANLRAALKFIRKAKEELGR